jgi:hypothetical protein
MYAIHTLLVLYPRLHHCAKREVLSQPSKPLLRHSKSDNKRDACMHKKATVARVDLVTFISYNSNLDDDNKQSLL